MGQQLIKACTDAPSEDKVDDDKKKSDQSKSKKNVKIEPLDEKDLHSANNNNDKKEKLKDKNPPAASTNVPQIEKEEQRQEKSQPKSAESTAPPATTATAEGEAAFAQPVVPPKLKTATISSKTHSRHSSSDEASKPQEVKEQPETAHQEEKTILAVVENVNSDKTENASTIQQNEQQQQQQHVDPNEKIDVENENTKNQEPPQQKKPIAPIIRPALEDSEDPAVSDALPFLQPEWFAAHGVDHPHAIRWCQSEKSVRIRIRPATADVGYTLTAEQVFEYNNDFVASAAAAANKDAEAYSDVDEEKEDDESSDENNGNDDDNDDSEVSIEQEVTNHITGEKQIIKQKIRLNRKEFAKLENGGETPKKSDKKDKKEKRKPQEKKPELPFRITLMLYAALAPNSYSFTQADGYLVLTGLKKVEGKWPSLLLGGADQLHAEVVAEDETEQKGEAAEGQQQTSVVSKTKKSLAKKMFGWISEEAPTPAMMLEDRALEKKLKKNSDSDSDDEK